MGKIQSLALTTVEVKLKKYQANAFQPQDEDQNISSSQSQRHWSGQVKVAYNAEILEFIFQLVFLLGFWYLVNWTLCAWRGMSNCQCFQVAIISYTIQICLHFGNQDFLCQLSKCWASFTHLFVPVCIYWNMRKFFISVEVNVGYWLSQPDQFYHGEIIGGLFKSSSQQKTLNSSIMQDTEERNLNHRLQGSACFVNCPMLFCSKNQSLL